MEAAVDIGGGGESPPSFYNGLGTIGVKVRFWESIRHLKLPNLKVGFASLCLMS